MGFTANLQPKRSIYYGPIFLTMSTEGELKYSK